jgi:hypothetical protein
VDKLYSEILEKRDVFAFNKDRNEKEKSEKDRNTRNE